MTGPPVASTWWWWPAGSDPADRPVLFFPPAGADQTVATALARQAPDLRLGVLRLPGRGPRTGERPPVEAGLLCRQIADQVLSVTGVTAVTGQAPSPVLVGHSFGGLLGYAVAAELCRRGNPPARLITVASASPASWQRALAGAAGTDFVPDRVALLLERSPVPGGLAGAGPALLDRVRGTLTVDIALSTQFEDAGPVPCPITAIRAAADEVLAPADQQGWQLATTAGCRQLVVEGDHFFYRSRPGQLISVLRHELAALERWSEPPARRTGQLAVHSQHTEYGG